MKKHLPLVICLMIIGSMHSFAQWEYGAYVGLNASRLSGDSPKNLLYDDKLGGTFGAVVSYKVKPDVRITFQPGYSVNRPTLVYQDETGDEVVYRDSVYLALDFVKLPLYLDVISDNRKWHFIGGVDFQISVKQSGETVQGEVIDLGPQLINLNPVVYLGFGRRISLGKPVLNIDLRFGQGILNLGDNQEDDTSLVPRIKTSSLELLATIEFGGQD